METQLLTQVGPGNPDGELMRQFWIPGSAFLRAEGRRRAGAPDAARRTADSLPDDSRPRWHHGSPMRPSLRLAVLRQERAGGSSLRVSRVEIRRRRSMRRRAQRPFAEAHSSDNQGKGLPHRRGARRSVGLYGPARSRAAVASRPGYDDAERQGQRPGACSGNATICRRWKAISIPRTQVSCISAAAWESRATSTKNYRSRFPCRRSIPNSASWIPSAA